MPEWAETRLMSEFADRILEGDPVVAIHKNPKSKLPAPAVPGLPREAAAFHFGKETNITLLSEPFVPGQHVTLRIQYGMSGHWELHRTLFGNKHSLLSFELESGKFLEFVDPRRFGRWKVGTVGHDIGNSSPCPELLTEYFPPYIFAKQKEPKYGNKLLCDVMLDQRVFFGVGNYLRAEIIDRANLNPFVQFKSLTSYQIKRLIVMTRKVCEAAYAIGGGKIFTWKNPLSDTAPKASEWMQCYKKKEWCIDRGGRRFWYDVKWPCPYTKNKYVQKAKTKDDTVEVHSNQ
jgi:formamidopyrimidine-DNA glycosylase